LCIEYNSGITLWITDGFTHAIKVTVPRAILLL
jgi:hypothetical protein